MSLYAGGTWIGDILVADIEELEQTDASELHARRLNAKEVLTPMKGENFMFPIADGTVKISGADAQTEEKNKKIFEENQIGLLQPHDKTHLGMLAKPKMTSGLSREIYLPSSRGTQSQTVRAD